MTKPYGYVRADGEGLFIYGEHQFQNTQGVELIPVYTHPKEWVGLTPQERDEINEQVYGAAPHHVAFHHAIEAKLKEKNT